MVAFESMVIQAGNQSDIGIDISRSPQPLSPVALTYSIPMSPSASSRTDASIGLRGCITWVAHWGPIF